MQALAMKSSASRRRPRTVEAQAAIPAILIAAVLIAISLSAPVFAAEEFIWSEPVLTATIEGSNEFYPGNTYEITVLVENKADEKEEILSVYPQFIPVPPSTALGTDVTLLPGDSPAVIKSGTYMIGDIPDDSSKTVTFVIFIPEDAVAGDYNLVLRTDSAYLSYGYIADETEIKYSYGDATDNINLPVVIKGEVVPEIISVENENLDSGKIGYIRVTFENTGSLTGKNAEALLTFSAASPIRAEGGSVFIGDIQPGGVTTVRFKATVDSSIDSGVYPATFLVEYTDENGDQATSEGVTVGIAAGSGPKFRVVSGTETFSPGETKTIEVEYQNIGDATAYGASSRITATSPFSASSDSASLGDIRPGENVSAYYTISLDSKAIAKPYGLNTEIKYYDSQDNLCLSDELKVAINAVETFNIVELLTNPVVIAVIMIVVVLGLYALFRRESREHREE